MATPHTISGFKTVKLLKKQTLGVGSYGSVCKVMCDDLLCAAKIIHPTLVEPNTQVSAEREHRLPFNRFEVECAVLEGIRHPNIIQFLGIYKDPETGLPVLLMELMDESLTHFLESSTDQVAYHIQLNLSLDISTALSFLHLNDIIHRDLSSNNILINKNGAVAKLTDFGMAKLASVEMSNVSNTMCPGTQAYMPPEALETNAVYTEKGDVFSFGVNIVQIVTKKFPKPGDRFKTVRINDPQFPTGSLRVCVSEIERRNNHISEIAPAHPLLPIALDCLKDQEGERPLARDLCQRLVALKDTPEYRESERAVPEKSCQISESQEKKSLQKQQNDKISKQITKEKELESLTQDIAATAISSKEENMTSSHDRVATPEQIQLTTIRSEKAPCKMYRDTDAVVIGNTAYFNPALTEKILTFDSTNDTWSRLPDTPIEKTTLAVIQNRLTTVGGRKTNCLFSFIEGEWIKVYPPMPTKRQNVIAVSTERALIVAGGEEHGRIRDKTLKIVEVMNIETRQWATAADLPDPLYIASATVCNDRLYMLGGQSTGLTTQTSVLTCSVDALLESCSPELFETNLTNPLLVRASPVWYKTAKHPCDSSTCVTMRGRLVTIGGDSSGDSSNTIVMYNEASNSWRTIGHLKIPRHSCFAIVLPDGTLMVVGGYIDWKANKTDSVEIVVE